MSGNDEFFKERDAAEAQGQARSRSELASLLLFVALPTLAAYLVGLEYKVEQPGGVAMVVGALGMSSLGLFGPSKQ